MHTTSKGERRQHDVRAARSRFAPWLAAGLVLSCASGSSSGTIDDADGAPVGDDGSAAHDGVLVDGSIEDSAVGDDAGMPRDVHADAAPEAGSDAALADADSPHDGGGSEGSVDGGLAEGGIGYMVGIKTNSVPTGPAKVEAWLGRPLDVAGTTITTTSYIGSGTAYTTSSGAHPLLECSFPLLSIFGESNNLSDLGQAASGAYDTTYEAMSMALAAWPNPLLSVRIGWEFNGNWYKWSNGAATHSTYANYVAAFKRAAALVRKHNPHVLIQWNIAWGQPDPTPYWPGAYDSTNNPGGVDVVSMDFYQANISQYNNGGKQSAWLLAQSGVTISLDWMVAFAQQKGVKVALSEYGAGSPSSGGETAGAGLDDGTWTAASIAWMNGLPSGLFLWTCWSDDAPADDIVTSGANPAEQTAWKSAWRGTHFAGSWWTGTTPP